MNRNFNLKGSIVALVTPFTNEGKVDYKSLEKLIDFHLNNQTDGIVICGTTGEASTLTKDEYCEVINFTAKKINKRIPLIAGSGCNATEKTIERSKMALDNGAESLLIVSPYYNKPMPIGYYKHYEAIARTTNAPIILYNVPGRTAKNLPVNTVLDLANNIENIVAVKEASGDLAQIMNLISQKPKDFKLYSGDDSFASMVVLMGGDGCISVAANIFPKEFSQLMHYSLKGEVEKAREIQYKFLKLMDLNFVESNPIPVKAALHMMGLIENNLRLPLYKMESESNLNLIRTELKKTGII